MVQLLEQASVKDRQTITAWLLEQLSRESPPSKDVYVEMLGGLVGSEVQQVPLPRPLIGTLPVGEDSQLVTVRLPQSQHAELRDWCGEHGFSVAAVIRGLIGRFLVTEAKRGQNEDEPR